MYTWSKKLDSYLRLNKKDKRPSIFKNVIRKIIKVKSERKRGLIKLCDELKN